MRDSAIRVQTHENFTKMGAVVQYCGHRGVFPADVFDFGEVVAINGSWDQDLLFTAGLKREPSWLKKATLQVVDFPHPGMWLPHKGVFVVPRAQVIKLSNGVEE